MIDRRLLAAFALTLPLLASGVPDASGQVRRPPPPNPGADADTPPGEAVAAPSGAEDEEGKEGGSDPRAGDDRDARSFSLWGDTSRFNRFSGWGGIGGTMGQWGMGRSMLVMMPEVQRDLALTEEQKILLREWTAQMRDRGREMAEAMRPTGQGDGGPGAGPGPGRGLPGGFDLMGMMNLMSQMMKENEAGLARILDKGQRRRLDQVALQMEGVTALARPEVAQAVGLLPTQVEAIQQILARSRTQQIFFWMQQGASRLGDRSNRGGPAAPAPPAGRPAPARGRPSSSPASVPSGRPGDAPPAAGPRDDDRPRPRDDEADDDASRAERTARSLERFERLRSGSDQIQDRTVQEILKILNRRQRNRFDAMLGPPFDPSSLTFGPPPGGRPSPDAPPRDGEPRPVPRAPEAGANR